MADGDTRAPSAGSTFMARMPPDAVVEALSFLSHSELGLAVMPASRALYRLADRDVLWVPLAERILNERLCLDEGVVRHVGRLVGRPIRGPLNVLYKEGVEKTIRAERRADVAAAATAAASRSSSTAAAAASVGTGRQLLKQAFVDAKRAVITAEELSRFRWHMRMRMFEEMRPFIHPESLLPTDAPPIHVHFEQTREVFTEVHPIIGQWARTWEWVPPRRSLVPGPEGGFQHGPAEPLNFSCLHWTGRPPLKVWRHPENWHVIMTHIHLQYASYLMPPVGNDAPLDADRAYIHPFNFHHHAAMTQSSDDDSSSDDDGQGA